MKLLLMVFAASLMMISLALAQIAVPQSTLQTLYSAGNSLYIYSDTLSTRTSVNVGGKGASQTYNFSSLTFALFKKDTLRLASSVPSLASRFPGSAIAISFSSSPNEQNFPLLMFENNSMTQPGEYMRFSGDSVLVTHSSPHELFLKFPVTYADSIRVTSTITDSVFKSGALSYSQSNSITMDHVVDGYGTLVLPGGESRPCLRVRMEEQSPYNYMGIRYITDNGIILMIDSHNSQPETGTIMNNGIFMLRGSPVTSVPYSDNYVPAEFSLLQNYPNPFNPTTTISFQLDSPGKVTLTVHNILGEIVSTLIDGEMGQGSHSIEWKPSGLPSGTYFYTLRKNSSTETRKLLLIR